MLPRIVALLAVLPLAAAISGTQFNASFARYQMFPLAAGAYSPHPQDCLKVVDPKAYLIKDVALVCDTLDNTCSGYLGVLPTYGAIVLSFRGTAGTAQLIDEVMDMLVKDPVPIDLGGKVGPYFKDAFDTIWTGGLMTGLTTLAQQNPSMELWVTGHSLGGTMGTIAAATIVSKGIFPANKVRMVSFGEPRAGDKTFASSMDDKFAAMHRVIHLRDLVPHVPPMFMKYQHHRQEIFYTADNMDDINTFRACAGEEDDTCSDDYFDASIDDHLHYYGLMVSEFGRNGCVGHTTGGKSISPKGRELERRVRELKAIDRALAKDKKMHPN